MNLYEFEISLSPYYGEEVLFLYKIRYKDSRLDTLSSFLVRSNYHNSVHPIDFLQRLQAVSDKRGFVEKELFEDIEMEYEVGKPFWERDWSTGHHLGEIACIIGPENPHKPMVYYRPSDDNIILVSQNNATYLPVMLPLDTFLKIIKWWTSLPLFPFSPPR